jgi:hypothetical protein
MVRRLLLIAAAATLALGGPACAAKIPGPRLAHFRLAGDEIAVPMPAGFCEQAGKFADQAQLMAAADNQNVTLLSLASCAEMAAGGPLSHYAYVKIPKRALTARVTLPELLAQMGAVPESEMKSAVANDKISPNVEQGLHAVTGRDVKVRSSIVPVDRDASGYYLAGVIDVSLGDKSGTIAAVVAITAAKGHILTYNLYGPRIDAPGVHALLVDAKAETTRILAAN